MNRRKHWHPACAKIWVVMNNPTEARTFVHKRDRFTCQDCGHHDRNGTFQVDHVKPLFEANGDPTYWRPENLTLLCLDCHHTKTQADMVRWRALKQPPSP